MKTKILLILLGGCAGAILISLWPPFIKEPKLSINDIHIAWLLNGKEFFVNNGSLLETNPEIVRLDNPKESFTPQKQRGFTVYSVLEGQTQEDGLSINIYPTLNF